jgi:cobalt-zinc-cadmium efflux system outer membrane protein
MKHKLLFILCITFLLGFYPGQGMSQGNLRLEQAVIQVLEKNPKLFVADYRAQALAARMRQALQKPADKVNLSLENFAGTDETLAFRSVEATLSLSRTLELGNKAQSRGEVVQQEIRVLENKKDIDRLNLLADTAQRFLHVAADQERVRLAGEALELMQLTENTVRERVRAGRTSETEMYRVQVEKINYILEVEHANHDLESSRVNLSILWNERHPGFDMIEADIFNIEEIPQFSELTEKIDRNPEIIQHLRAEDLARAKIRLMESRVKPDIDLSAGLRYLGDSNDVALIFSASLPLGSYSRAQPGIDEAESLALIDPLNMEQQRLELYATLFNIYEEMNHARDSFNTLAEEVIPAAEKMVADYESGYQTGRYSLLELTQAQQLLRNARSRLLEMAVIYHSSKIEIDRLTGAQLTQW